MRSAAVRDVIVVVCLKAVFLYEEEYWMRHCLFNIQHICLMKSVMCVVCESEAERQSRSNTENSSRITLLASSGTRVLWSGGGVPCGASHPSLCQSFI